MDVYRLDYYYHFLYWMLTSWWPESKRARDDVTLLFMWFYPLFPITPIVLFPRSSIGQYWSGVAFWFTRMQCLTSRLWFSILTSGYLAQLDWVLLGFVSYRLSSDIRDWQAILEVVCNLDCEFGLPIWLKAWLYREIILMCNKSVYTPFIGGGAKKDTWYN